MMTLLLAVLLATTPVDNNEFLPQFLTAEEQLRIDEIGRGHIITAPPGGWVETPGEFEQMRGAFLTWRYGYGSGQDVIFREIVREVVDVAKAYIIVRSSTEQSSVTSYLNSGGVSLDSVEFYQYSNNSIWIRDYGPWFMRKADDTEGIVDFVYNRPRPLDDTIPWRIGASWGIPVYGSPLEHPGGNFMVDGLGAGFASDLIYDENPGHSAQEIDSLMLAYCGLEQFIVVPKINIEYTGHIDLWTKMINDTLVLVGEYAPGHPNYDLLNQNAAFIASHQNRDGINYRIARIPMPWSMSSAPPSYLNSLFVNDKVLVPLWNEPEDSTALAIYEQLMPGHQVVGINCSYMAGSGGAIHCITIQIPRGEFLHIKHYPLPDSTTDTLNDYRVRAEITTSSALVTDSTVVFYKVGSGSSFSPTPLSAVVDTPGVHAGYIPAQSPGDTVFYYLLARNDDDIRRTAPNHCPPHVHSFRIGGSVAAGEEPGERLQSSIQVFPNPATDALSVTVHSSAQETATIEVFNILGQRVLAHDLQVKTGKNKIHLKLTDGAGRPLAQGVYFYSARIGGKIFRDKILVVR